MKREVAAIARASPQSPTHVVRTSPGMSATTLRDHGSRSTLRILPGPRTSKCSYCRYSTRVSSPDMGTSLHKISHLLEVAWYASPMAGIATSRTLLRRR